MSNTDNRHFAFTIKYNCKQSSLRSEATIQYNGKQYRGTALWDTGASTSCISRNVVSALELIPTGKASINTASSATDCCTYLVDIILPNNVRIPNVKVCDTVIDLQGLSLLIGMDIIGVGDLSVSGYNGKTSFSFCIPPKRFTDYVIMINTEKLIGTHGKGKRKK